jgi:hypothetical protein
MVLAPSEENAVIFLTYIPYQNWQLKLLFELLNILSAVIK